MESEKRVDKIIERYHNEISSIIILKPLHIQEARAGVNQRKEFVVEGNLGRTTFLFNL
jgi:hypothetical protein